MGYGPWNAINFASYNYYKTTGSTDLTDVLSGGEYDHNDKPVDSYFWDSWVECVGAVKDGKEPKRKKWASLLCSNWS